MKDQMIFKRYEMKYMLNRMQFEELKEEMEQYMIADEHGKSTICSLYFDTPTFLLIRRSLEKPVYKEKLRLRSYGVADADTIVFVELKKKYDSVVYKRRVGMTEWDAERYLLQHEQVMDTQITREIDYCMTNYEKLAPSILLSYEREAYYGKGDHDFRVTFDQNILWRDYDLSLCKGIYGRPLLSEDQVLMEVKTAGGIPMWMVKFMSERRIYKTSFSKYGMSYTQKITKQMKPMKIMKTLNGGIQKYA